NWKNGQLKLISATTAFGIGLNINDININYYNDEEACPETNSSADIIQQYEYLQRKQDSIFEVVAYCESVYECRQQQAYQSFLWPGDLPIVEYNNCDNCDHRKKDDAC
ncbi:74_t:CDS:2, partial [Cetraspora pellucida]